MADLGTWYTLYVFRFFSWEITVDFSFAFLRTNPFWKEVYPKRKEFSPNESKVFPFRLYPISERKQNHVDRIACPKVYQFPKTIPMYQTDTFFPQYGPFKNALHSK